MKAVDTNLLYKEYIDNSYRDFSKRLSPTDSLERVGVSIPNLRKIAKTISPDDIEIKYHEDVILKGFAIASEKLPFANKIPKLNKLLPYLSSWDHTDTIQCTFKPSKENKEEMYLYFKSLLEYEEIFIRRLGIVWLMSNRKNYDYNEIVNLIISSDSEDEYYISTAVAWALSYFYFDNRAFLPILNEVSITTRKRALQKIRESRRYKGEPLDIKANNIKLVLKNTIN